MGGILKRLRSAVHHVARRARGVAPRGRASPAPMRQSADGVICNTTLIVAPDDSVPNFSLLSHNGSNTMEESNNAIQGAMTIEDQLDAAFEAWTESGADEDTTPELDALMDALEAKVRNCKQDSAQTAQMECPAESYNLLPAWPFPPMPLLLTAPQSSNTTAQTRDCSAMKHTTILTFNASITENDTQLPRSIRAPLLKRVASCRLETTSAHTIHALYRSRSMSHIATV